MESVDKLKEEYRLAIEHLRNTSKWILTVFAAVAGVLVAGLQLSNLGKVEFPYLAVSACAFLVALVAVLVIINKTVRVLRIGTVTESILRDFAPKSKDIRLNDPSLLCGYENVDDFIDNYIKLRSDYLEAQNKGDQKTVERLIKKVMTFDYHNTQLFCLAKYAIVLKAFKEAIQWLFVCAVVAAIAIGVFAWATGQNPSVQIILQSPPSAAAVTLNASGRNLLTDSLGQQCVEQTPIPVIILSIQDGRFEVVTIPSAKCRVAKFTVDKNIGNIKK